MPETPPPGSGPRLWEAMPRPLLVVFALVCVAALVGAVVLLIDPPERAGVSLFDRRPAPKDRLTHDVGKVEPVVPPRTQVPLDAPCDEVTEVRAIAGPAGVARVRAMLVQACRLTEGTSPELALAVRRLSGVTIRFAAFVTTGVESTLEQASGTLYLNVRFASKEISVSHVVPILLHEVAHGPALTGITCPGGPPPRPGQPPRRVRRDCIAVDESLNAEAELYARGIEVQACRHLIPAPDWPRWCRDARAITAMPREDALRALRAAGYA